MRATPFARGRIVFALKRTTESFEDIVFGTQICFCASWRTRFSYLASRLSDFELIEADPWKCGVGRFEVSMESLILAQDERWRRA